MSEDNQADTCCASCGIAEIDDVKLKECDDCDLARYCSDDCQRDHKSVHEEACKKRAAELRDEILFKQPESTNVGDCPICCLPLSLDKKKYTMMGCCSKLICIGCRYANQKRETEMRRELSCPFCREALPKTKKAGDKQNMKRVKANDPDALCYEGATHCRKGHYSRAFASLSKAAELGNAEAHFKLATMCFSGSIEMNEEKGMYHFEEAAIGGHPGARCALGINERGSYNAERAVKHWIIGATQGHDDSIKELMNAFKHGLVDKEVLASALRAHKAAVDATKSPQREEAELYHRAKGLL